MASLYTLFRIHYHIVTQIVEAHFVICTESDIGVIGFFSFLVCFFVDNQTDFKAHKSVKFAHPFGVTLCKVVVDRNNVNSVTRKRVKVGGKCSHKGFTFTGFHFRNTSLMENDTAENLYGIVLHTENTPGCLAAGGKSLGKNIVKGFTLGKTFFELGGFCLKLTVGKSAVFGFVRKNPVFKTADSFDFF